MRSDYIRPLFPGPDRTYSLLIYFSHLSLFAHETKYLWAYGSACATAVLLGASPE